MKYASIWIFVIIEPGHFSLFCILHGHTGIGFRVMDLISNQTMNSCTYCYNFRLWTLNQNKSSSSGKLKDNLDWFAHEITVLDFNDTSTREHNWLLIPHWSLRRHTWSEVFAAAAGWVCRCFYSSPSLHHHLWSIVESLVWVTATSTQIRLEPPTVMMLLK